MSAIAEGIAGAIQGFGNLGIGIYNAYQQSQNYKYQKALQKEIFHREDTAIQRQVADAEKAGFNRFAVMGGSGAGAGSVVSTTAPQADNSMASSAVDALNAMYTLAQQKESAKQAKINTETAEMGKKLMSKKLQEVTWNTALSVVNSMRQAGYHINGILPDGGIYYEIDDPNYGTRFPDFENSPDQKLFNLNMRNLQNESDNLDFETEWKGFNQWLNVFSKLLNGANNAGSAYRGFRGRK